MTQQPFSRPGAIDLSALKRPAPASPAGGGPPGGAGGGVPGAGSSYSLEVTEESFQAVIEASMTAPVLLVFYSPTRSPESVQLADDVRTVTEELEGRFLAGVVDIDAQPGIAEAMQIPSIPLVVAVLDGRPAPLMQEALPIGELRLAFTQVLQQLTTQGMTTRHQPRHPGVDADAAGAEADVVDPRYAAAEDAMGEGDFDLAVVEYEKLRAANPADTEAAAGLAMATLLQRTAGVDPEQARAAASASPDDVDAQTLVADLDLLDGRVEEAFDRLVGLVRRSGGSERDDAREHLLGLFAAVGNDDARVLKGRQLLASALF